jgi:hypothetical protein
MNQFEGLLLLLGLSAGLLLAGYWLAARLETAAPSTRLAVAPLAGLGCLLFAVSVVNFFVPLAGAGALLCLAPIGVTLSWPSSRKRLWRDLAAVASAPGVWWLAALGTIFLIFLLWPMLSDGQCVFYDGTSNHDSFFWISGAEHLKRHSYMTPPLVSATQPLTNTAAAFTTLVPAWGRMGAEGLLALASSVSWTSPLKLYLYATACLFLPWLSAVFLSAKAFYSGRLSFGTKAVLVSLQPIFIFYYSNANLPNLLGALTGAAAVLATQQIFVAAAGPSREFRAWWVLLVLSLHGLECSYPEMVPFVLLPCGLLWLRPWFARRSPPPWRACGWVAGALPAAVLLNPVTTMRAVHGFASSFEAARANQGWANLLEPVDLAGFVPALTTLSISAARHLGSGLGGLVTLVLVAALGLAWWRARDRFGVLAAFAGSIVLAAYTLATGFSYGWQKTVQFAGVFFAAAFPAAAFDAQVSAGRAPGIRRWLARASLALTVGFLVFAVLMSCRDIAKWSSRKVISQDWFLLRDKSRGELRDAPVLVEAGTFQMSFFYSMWSAYFLPESRLYFGARGDENGGYLRGNIVQEGVQRIPEPQAVLVGRPWAGSFDANSPRLVAGREFALLEKSNRVLAMKGVYPLYGLPDFTSTLIDLDILPHSASSLSFKLTPRGRADWPAGTWEVSRQVAEAGPFSAEVSGPPPWRIKVPLVSGQRNRVTVTLTTVSKSAEPYPFILGDLRVENQP